MKTTLIVDDSATSRMVLKVYLQAIGQTEVFDTDDPEKALSLAGQCQPEVVFMDYNLEDVSGIDVATVMQHQGISAKYILLTGDSPDSRAEEALNAGFFKVVQKPISQEKVVRIFASL